MAAHLNKYLNEKFGIEGKDIRTEIKTMPGQKR